MGDEASWKKEPKAPVFEITHRDGQRFQAGLADLARLKKPSSISIDRPGRAGADDPQPQE